MQGDWAGGLGDPEVHYRAVFDALPNPCALLSTEFTVLDVNAAYVVLLGRSRRELLGRALTGVLPFDPEESSDGAGDRIQRSLRRVLRSGLPEVMPIQRNEIQLTPGSSPLAARYWISTATPIKDDAQTVVALLHKIQDVTPVVLSIAADLGADMDPAVVDLEGHSEVFGLMRELQQSNALLLEAREREREISLTLQRAMLPARIPKEADGRVAARYLPASSAMSVGGDWYDVAVLPDGRLAAAVGDVVGQGLEAAAAMGQLRSALSAVTVADVGPGNALEVLDRFARQVDQATATTAVKVVLDLDRGVATYSSAGHLPPLLLHPDGTVEALDKALGPPLSSTVEAEARPQASTRFAQGAMLVLYTDGLVERRDEDLSRGISRLVACLRAHHGLSADALADAVIAQLRQGTTSHDDTAVLVIEL